MDTRFSQLNVAVDLQLWQEAFRSVEDLHALMTLSKRPPKPATMAIYYNHLHQIFLVGSNYLMHAAAYKKYFTMVIKSNLFKTMSADDRQQLASSVLLSALAVSIEITHPLKQGLLETEEQRSRVHRLANLINIAKVPTRETLIRDLVFVFCFERRNLKNICICIFWTMQLSLDILEQASAEIRELYTVLEVQSNPLTLCKQLQPLLEKLKLNEKTSKYVSAIQHVALTRLLEQLSTMYKVSLISLSFFFLLSSTASSMIATKNQTTQNHEDLIFITQYT